MRIFFNNRIEYSLLAAKVWDRWYKDSGDYLKIDNRNLCKLIEI